jgi:DNA-binding response OmpR family regulator
VIDVQDFGIGLEPEEIGKVFDRFYRGGDPLTRSVKGTGLGLTLVRQIVDAHGGRVEVDSAPGRGSTFRLKLPVTVRRDGRRGRRAAHSFPRSGGLMQRILIVEDEESILMALQDDLEMEGYRVDTATDGAAGLDMARSKSYDVIVLDVMLPRLDGFAVCTQLRREGVATPVLILTARGQEIDRVLGLELGADDYVTKPFSPRELVARIRAVLRRARSAAAPLDSYGFGEVEVDFRKFSATRAGLPLELTTREYALLRLSDRTA